MTPIKSSDWRPGADNGTLRARARLLADIREFFAERDVMEVVTPVLGASGVTDVHLENLSLVLGDRRYFLQTSPEYAMKRLLAAGAGSIYQICPAFRGGEVSERHNTEFTMLEWYRPGFGLDELMAEVESLVREVAAGLGVTFPAFGRARYKDLFQKRYGENPHTLDVERLRMLVEDNPQIEAGHLGQAADRNDYLDLLFATGIESDLTGPVMIRDFPASQAVLATVSENDEGDSIADRFELFIGGLELANGYFELTDPRELASRMAGNNEARRRRRLPVIPVDDRLLAALAEMPACAGVALGVDRLLMLLTGETKIDGVLAFSDSRL